MWKLPRDDEHRPCLKCETPHNGKIWPLLFVGMGPLYFKLPLAIAWMLVIWSPWLNRGCRPTFWGKKKKPKNVYRRAKMKRLRNGNLWWTLLAFKTMERFIVRGDCLIYLWKAWTCVYTITKQPTMGGLRGTSHYNRRWSWQRILAIWLMESKTLSTRPLH
jgi:hypothetical protein